MDDHYKLTDLNEKLDGSFVAERWFKIHLSYYFFLILFLNLVLFFIFLTMFFRVLGKTTVVYFNYHAG